MSQPHPVVGNTSEFSPRLQLALKLAFAAGEKIMPHYQSETLNVISKADSSPVTIADRNAEEAIRSGIRDHFPDDAILGEEYGNEPGGSGYRWIVDPLDGTKSFIHGVPLFGTLIGIEHNGVVESGVCHFPALNETCWAETGRGSWWQNNTGSRPPIRCRAAHANSLSAATMCFTTVAGFTTIGRPDVIQHFVGNCLRARGWGDCYGHVLVATGRAHLMVDAQMNPWDIAALVPIVNESGAVFMNWDGGCNVDAGNGISVVPGLIPAVKAVIAPR